MDTERDHLVEPVRHRERGIALWVGLALGFAGIIVTIGGIYEWNQRKTGGRSAVLATSTAAAGPARRGESSDVVQLRRELEAARAETERAKAAAWRERVDRQIAEDRAGRPTRCIDNVRFEQFGREWRNVGRC